MITSQGGGKPRPYYTSQDGGKPRPYYTADDSDELAVSEASGVKFGSASASTSSTGTMPLPRFTISTRRQRFSLLRGRHSSMRTISPTWQVFSSSCAWKCFVCL